MTAYRECLTEEQKCIRPLERELLEVKPDHEILKKVATGARNLLTLIKQLAH